MPTTPVYALPYPAAADPADVPLDMQELAERIELVFPGKELAYAQITANKSVTATAEASADIVVAAPAITFDGSTDAVIEFFARFIAPPNVVGATISVLLYQDGASLGYWTTVTSQSTGGSNFSCHLARRLRPAVGSRTYAAAAVVTSSTGTIAAGPGGGAGGQSVPAYIRITRV